jgi:transcriptional regulator GlxA family with amidase domain
MEAEIQYVDVDVDDQPKRFVFVLLDNFSMISFSCAIECLRLANRMSGQALFNWCLQSDGGEAVTCSNHTSFNVDGDLSELDKNDVIVLCGGVNIQAATSKRLLSW